MTRPSTVNLNFLQYKAQQIKDQTSS